MKEDLVSIIIPVYNAEKLISKTINSVINQTYKNWELYLIDDCSSDNSFQIIKEFMQKENRIKYFKLEKNSGAAVARNVGLKKSTGRFVAYLDSDDAWDCNKIFEQVNFMKKNNYAFTCTSYIKITENDKKLKIINMPKKITYNKYLSNTIIQTVGVMIDTKIIDKKLLIMSNIKRRQDAATWCQILKSGYNCYGLQKPLSYYRVVKNSLSSNKIKAAYGTWNLYRKIEKLSLIKSLFCFCGYAINATRKRIYIFGVKR